MVYCHIVKVIIGIQALSITALKISKTQKLITRITANVAKNGYLR